SSVPYPLFSENSFLTILALLAVEIRPAGFSNQLNLHDSIRRNSRHHYCRGTHHLRRKSLHLCASLSLFRFGFSSAFSPQSPISIFGALPFLFSIIIS
ncbi:hypothetical protein LINPERHAP1_LOCUS31184, partial [Linum perenne]